jgi:2'-5' RNA ligase
MSTSEFLRLFTALPLPPNAIQTLGALQQGLPGTRWIRSENLHLTLRFLGQTPAGEVSAIATALQDVRFPPFAFSLAGVDLWTGPGILHAVVPSHPALSALKHAIDHALAVYGLPPEERPFRPHVTLARLRRTHDREALAAWREQHGGLHLQEIPATRFHLYESRSTAEGVRYLPLASYDAAQNAPG